MAKILFTWELGGGLGHMMQILPLARELQRRGHRVFVAVRDLSRARTVFGDELVTLLQAPMKVIEPDYASPGYGVKVPLSMLSIFNVEVMAGTHNMYYPETFFPPQKP